ncbi:Synaptic vesicle transporter SVOP and related transporters (major facilitator superfamily) [Ceraceosorus bombacis]|uniref:Synaptic vesicle transporter SVOP and related transporters (Major facilitator superfamily) n=1 Tax=Ceraceosorus bombacis TaxID=401625 RepID=A0A0N7L9L3_9BASI|nr:Synaptic vesicle transporter SVOP and related transporters (major facilitator superfamily) [Ceraceosorus bombacis]
MASIGRTPASERSQYLTPASERSQYITPPLTPGLLSSEGHGGSAFENSGRNSAGEAGPGNVSSPSDTGSSNSTQVPERSGTGAQKANAALEREADDAGGDLEKSRAEKQKEEEDEENRVDWDGPDDPANPQNWSLRKKWWLSGLVIFLTINCTFASAAPSGAVMPVMMQFQISEVIATLALTSSFLIGYCIGPLFWSTFSELFGRKPIFIISMFSYTAFIIGPPLAKNWWTIFITRLLSGAAASAPLTNAGGLIADVMNPTHRGFAMSAFSGSVFLGPSLAPVVGSFVTQTVGWEWVFWVLLIYSFLSWAFVAYFLEETFAPVLLQKKAVRLRKEGNAQAWAPLERQDFSFKGIAERTLFRPFHILALEPMLVLITIYISVVYGLLYGLFEGVPVVFATLRPTEFNLGLSSLPFLAVLIGTTVGLPAA